MGKKRVSVLGSEAESEIKAKRTVQREQKKIREGGKVVIPPVGVVPESTETPKTPSSKKVKVRSKNYVASKTQVDSQKLYSLADAIKLLRNISYSKVNDTVELHLNLKEKGISKDLSLPHSTGKTRKIAVCSDAILSQIESGKIDFDVLLAAPADMAKLVKYAKVLGPRGLMPNPKSGTVVDNPQATAKKMTAENSVTLKTEKDAPLIHTTVGKLTASDPQLIANVQAILAALSPKVIKAVLKSTMSPAIKIVI